jgi:hypothetical protein
LSRCYRVQQLSIFVEIASLSQHIEIVIREIQLCAAIAVAAAILFIFIHPAVVGFPAPPSKVLKIFVPIAAALISVISVQLVITRIFYGSHQPHPAVSSSLRLAFICTFLC